MVDKKTSEETAVTGDNAKNLLGPELVRVVQDGVNKVATVSDFRNASNDTIYTSTIVANKDGGDGPIIGAAGIGIVAQATSGGSGDGANPPGDGGAINVTAGNGGSGTANNDNGGNGGDIILQPGEGGDPNGAGTLGSDGGIMFINPRTGDPGLLAFADDAAAAAGGVKVGCLYRTASVVKIRVA